MPTCINGRYYIIFLPQRVGEVSIYSSHRVIIDLTVNGLLNGEILNCELNLTYTMKVYTANHLKDSVLFTSCRNS